jgi:hypothetical protein
MIYNYLSYPHYYDILNQEVAQLSGEMVMKYKLFCK